MRILRAQRRDFTPVILDVDEKTAIGINFQRYDISNIVDRKFTFSNFFTLPKTSKNIKFFDFADNFQSNSVGIYNKYKMNYYIDNFHIIKDGQMYVDEIGDRIKLHVSERNSFWDDLKELTYQDFFDEYIEWLRDVEGEYIQDNYLDRSFSTFLGMYTIPTSDHLIIPYYFGEYYWYEDGGTLKEDTESHLYGSGGRVCTYCKSIFKFLEYKYDVDFLTDSTDSEIIWNDTYASNCYIPIRDLGIVESGLYGFAFRKRLTNNYVFKEKERIDKTMYGFVKAFIHKFNIILDTYTEVRSGTDVYVVEMRRFDDIETMAEVVDFSGNFVLDKTKMKPFIQGWGQINLIKNESVYPGGSELEGRKSIICNNKNIERYKDILTIDNYHAGIITNTNSESVLDLSTEESNKTWVFMVEGGTTTDQITIEIDGGTSANKYLKIAALYGLSGEYEFISDIVLQPKVFEAYKWLTLKDIFDLKFFKQYFIRELGGSFFINKISGFNPEKSNSPTKLELLKISNKTPDNL